MSIWRCNLFLVPGIHWTRACISRLSVPRTAVSWLVSREFFWLPNSSSKEFFCQPKIILLEAVQLKDLELSLPNGGCWVLTSVPNGGCWVGRKLVAATRWKPSLRQHRDIAEAQFLLVSKFEGSSLFFWCWRCDSVRVVAFRSKWMF